jgi:response regulator RpfG family c-di-GMP phosphodiesterase
MNSEVKNSKLVILVIDDNPLELGLIRLVIQKIFPELKCICLTKPPDWENYFQSQHVDVVIIDYRLPEKNGLEHIKELRKYKPELPAYLMTALERDEIDQDVIKSGATDLIVKDRNYSNLVSKLNTLILNKSFQNLKTEIEILKKVIKDFSNILILKIDYERNCNDVLGDSQKLFDIDAESLAKNGWEKFFGEIFEQLIQKSEKATDVFPAPRYFEIQINDKTYRINSILIASSDFYYLIILPL